MKTEITVSVYSRDGYLLGWHDADSVYEIKELYGDPDGKIFRYKVKPSLTPLTQQRTMKTKKLPKGWDRPDNFTKTTSRKGFTFHYNKVARAWFWQSSLGWIPAYLS